MASMAQLPAQLNPLAEIQKRFALMNLSGDLRVVDRQQIADILAGRSSGEVSFYKRADAALLLRRYAEILPISFDPKKVIAVFWIDPLTHVYDAVAFSPLLTPASTLNFWSPSPVRPAQGDWSLIRDFLLHVICDGNTSLYDYLLKFLAHMQQRPEEKPGVMLVMLSGQGTGKGTLFKLVRAFWPRTTLRVSDVDHVIGTFNAPLERAYAVCLDEAIFSGDRKALDRLKSLITEPHITIEAKYQPRRAIESFHRFFAASNHDHFARVEVDDRRFVFFRVSASRQGDHAYFDTVHGAIEDPNVIAAMAYDLLSIDLSGFNVRQRPRTPEHTQQKLKSLDGFDRYWHEVLQTGSFAPSCEYGEQWGVGRFIDTATLKTQCEQFHRPVKQHQPLTEQVTSAALKKWCPSSESNRRIYQGRQARGYDLPELDIARREFEAAIGAKVDWPDSPAATAETGQATS